MRVVMVSLAVLLATPVLAVAVDSTVFGPRTVSGEDADRIFPFTEANTQANDTMRRLQRQPPAELAELTAAAATFDRTVTVQRQSPPLPERFQRWASLTLQLNVLRHAMVDDYLQRAAAGGLDPTTNQGVFMRDVRWRSVQALVDDITLELSRVERRDVRVYDDPATEGHWTRDMWSPAASG